MASWSSSGSFLKRVNFVRMGVEAIGDISRGFAAEMIAVDLCCSSVEECCSAVEVRGVNFDIRNG